ncbi:MAG: PEP-CTERM sorting domain-containing protein [Pirellulales bacterium]
MGTGALDAKRAVKQLAGGEYHNNLGPAQIPAIGWDYQSQPGLNQARKYQFDKPLVGGSFVSITLAYDRTVTFDSDGGSPNFYDIGDTFNPSATFVPGQDQRNDLDLYLLPKGATAADLDNPIAFSDSSDSTIEHLFAQIPTTGEYEFWVYQFDNNLGVSNENYAVAWWADVLLGVTGGDYNGDNVVNAQDYNVWRGGLGNNIAPGTGADGNGNGVIDAADYVVWRDHLGTAGAGSGSSLASVPEPSGLALLALIGVIAFCRRRN